MVGNVVPEGQKTIKINIQASERVKSFKWLPKKFLQCFQGSALLLLIHTGRNYKYVCAARKALGHRIFEGGMEGWGRRKALNFLEITNPPWWCRSQKMTFLILS